MLLYHKFSIISIMPGIYFPLFSQPSFEIFLSAFQQLIIMIQDNSGQSSKQLLGLKQIHQQVMSGSYHHILQLRLIKKTLLINNQDPQLKSSAPRLLLDFLDGRKTKVRGFIFGKFVFRWLKYLKQDTIYKVLNYVLEYSEFVSRKLSGAYQYCFIVTSKTEFFRCSKTYYHPSYLDTIVSLQNIVQSNKQKQVDTTGIVEQIGRMFYEGGKMVGKIQFFDIKSKKRAELIIFDKSHAEQLKQGIQYIFQNVVYNGQFQEKLLFHASPFCKISQVQHNFFKQIQAASESDEVEQIMSAQMQLILEKQFLNIQRPMTSLNLLSSFSEEGRKKVQFVDDFCQYECQFCGIRIKRRFQYLRSKVQRCKIEVGRMVLKHYFRYHLENLQKIYHLIQERQMSEQSNLSSEQTIHFHISAEDVKKLIFSGRYKTVLLYDSFSFGPQFYRKIDELSIQNEMTLVLQITEQREDSKPQNSYVTVDSQLQCNNIINDIVTSFLLYRSQGQLALEQIIVFSNEIQVLYSSTESLISKKLKNGENKRRVRIIRQKTFNKKRFGKTQTQFLDQFELKEEQANMGLDERNIPFEDIYFQMNYFI